MTLQHGSLPFGVPAMRLILLAALSAIIIAQPVSARAAKPTKADKVAAAAAEITLVKCGISDAYTHA